MSEQAKYFDLHTTGVGYLNRAREVKPRRGEPFLAVEVAALRGRGNAIEHTRFDCRVAGTEAQRLVRHLMPAIAAQAQVLVGFRLSDVHAQVFTYTQGERQGQPGVSLKARLLRIAWAKVDGGTVYRAPAREKAADTA